VHKWLAYFPTPVLHPNKSSADNYFIYPMPQGGFRRVMTPRLIWANVGNTDTLNSQTRKSQRSALSMRTLTFSPENFQANNAHPIVKPPLHYTIPGFPPLTHVDPMKPSRCKDSPGNLATGTVTPNTLNGLLPV